MLGSKRTKETQFPPQEPIPVRKVKGLSISPTEGKRIKNKQRYLGEAGS